VLIFLLLGFYPWVLLLTWLVALYLTFVETQEQRLDRMHTLWWMLLVFLTHFLGYLALRGWAFYRRRATA
jgi:TctA family transporter